jgi:hypothetical protein
MEDRQTNAPTIRVGDELTAKEPRKKKLLEKKKKKQFSENGARPAPGLGGANAPPLCRLGALVFRP